MIYKLCLAAAFALFSFNASAAEAQTDESVSDYERCLQAATEFTDDETALCMSEEVKRLDRAIATLYQQTFLPVDRIAKWNNGNGMFRGNIKDMQDQFNGYRSRFCSFYAVTMQIYSGSQAYLRNDCMMKLTQEYYNRLLQMSRDYDADLD